MDDAPSSTPPETDEAPGDAGPSAGPSADPCALAETFTAALARQQDIAERREDVITRLHDELERLRRGEIDAALDLVRHAMIRLHDQILRQADHITAPLSVTELETLLRALADEAAEAVAGTGAERYVPEAGEAYDAAWHRPVGRAEAAAPEQDRTVARVVAAGFAYGERAVRKAEVVVSRWQPNGTRPAAPS